MSKEPSQPPGPDPPLPVSSFLTPVDGLIRDGTLSLPAIPGQLAALDRFEVLRLIGAGGMGLVFLARDSASGHKVAIKLLKPELAANETAVKRFLREAHHVQQLRHPGIVPVLEVSTRDGRHYFVMPYFERASLARLLRSGQPLSREEIPPLAQRIAEALQHAHQHGIIHRDLKPDNILIDHHGSASLADFGLARNLVGDSFLDPGRGHCEGTAPYMSPAVAANEAEDTRADIYSFGALLYEMVTGKPPYDGPDSAEILRQVRLGPPKGILDINPQAPRDLALIAEGAMQRAHRDRYASMSDIVTDLERVAQGMPPLGPRGRPGLANWPKRTKRILAGVAALLAAGVSFGLLRPWMMPRLELTRTIQLPEVAHWERAQLGEWTGDQEPDFYLVQDGKCLVVSSRGELLKRFAPDEPRTSGLGLDLVADVNGDGLDEAFLSWADGTNLTLAAFNQNLWPLERWNMVGTVHQHRWFGTNYSGIIAKTIVGLDRDGRRALVGFVETGWGLRPRGVCRFDLSSQGLRWIHESAPPAWALATLDLDGDGKLDVVVGDNSTSNGNRLPDGTDDGHCYLHAVSHDGRGLWTREVGTHHVRATPLLVRKGPRNAVVETKSERVTVPMNGTNELRLYAWLAAAPLDREPNGEREMGEIIAVNYQGNIVGRYDADAYLLSCVASDVDGDGMEEILASDRLGRIHELNPDLSLRRKVTVTAPRFGSVELKIVAVTNLTRGVGKQVVLTSAQYEIGAGRNPGNNRVTINVRFWHDLSVVVLDSRLRTLATHVFTERRADGPEYAAKVADMDRDGGVEILWLDERVRILRLKQSWP